MTKGVIHTLQGHVFDGGGNASENLDPVADLIAERVGLPPLQEGTLNVRLQEHYPITAVTAVVTDVEYNHHQECIKLRRCRIRRAGTDGPGLRGVVVRPSQHENPDQDHWTRLEVMSPHHLRTELSIPAGVEGVLVEVELEGGYREVPSWWEASE